MNGFVPTINNSRTPVSFDVFSSSDEAVNCAQKFIDAEIAGAERRLCLEKAGIASGVSKTIEALRVAKATSMPVVIERISDAVD